MKLAAAPLERSMCPQPSMMHIHSHLCLTYTDALMRYVTMYATQSLTQLQGDMLTRLLLFEEAGLPGVQDMSGCSLGAASENECYAWSHYTWVHHVAAHVAAQRGRLVRCAGFVI